MLPWGAWAEFSQRHIALLIGTVDRFYRHRYGDAKSANQASARSSTRELSGLTMYPVATSMRTKGVKGGDADLTHINEAITVAVAAPELITARLWAWLESGSRYEVVRRAMPTAAKWFIPSSAKVPYDAALRVQHVGQVTPSGAAAVRAAGGSAVRLLDRDRISQVDEREEARHAGVAGSRPPSPPPSVLRRSATPQATPPANAEVTVALDAQDALRWTGG